MADGGKYHRYLKQNGGFSINRVPSGSYLVEVVSPNHVFDSVRVDITKSGRICVREVNFTKPTKDLEKFCYPLHFKTSKTVAAQFFEEKETLYTWIVKNPKNMFQIALYTTLAVLMAVTICYANNDRVTQNQTTASEFNDNMRALMWWSHLPSLEEILATLFMGGDIKELFAKVFEEESKPNRNKDALGSTRKKKSAAAKNKRRPK